MIPLSRRAALASGLALAGAGRAFGADPAAAGRISGWREAIVITTGMAPWIEVLTDVGGWEVAASSGPDASLNNLWHLPAAARVEQIVMRNRGETSGMIRLINVVGAPQVRIRSHDQAWETGGIAALDLRVVDLEATRLALESRGWRAPSDPVRYEAYPGIEVIQWAPLSPDGVRLSFIQRLSPPLTGWPQLRHWSRAANAAIVVRDMAAAHHFFAEIMGLAVAGRSHSVGRPDENVMGLPWSMQARLATEIEAFGSSGGDGAIELISMPAAQGRDYASRATPPNLGLASLLFIVPDAAIVRNRLLTAGVNIDADVQPVSLPPYGPCHAFSAIATDGVVLTFVQI